VRRNKHYACAQGFIAEQFFRWSVLTAAELEELAMLGVILLIILILLLVGSLPAWPYSGGWGYGPSGLLGTVLVIVLILVLIGRV
jgi:hypothetical protein